MTNFSSYSQSQINSNSHSQEVNQTKKNNQFISNLQRLGNWLVTFLTSGNQVRIWQSSDRFGNTYWHAYDPQANLSIKGVSEEELRVWLEKRYYL